MYRIDELERNTQNLHRDLSGSFQLEALPLMQKELIGKIVWLNSRGIRSRKCISTNSPHHRHSRVAKRVSRSRYVSVQVLPHKPRFWIEEVEMVDSVDDLNASRSMRRRRFPNFEMLDAKTASALKKIILNSYFKKKVSLVLCCPGEKFFEREISQKP